MRSILGLYQLLGVLNVLTLVIMAGAALAVALVVKPRGERPAAWLLTGVLALVVGLNVAQAALGFAGSAFLARFGVDAYRWLVAALSLIEALVMAGIGGALLLFNRGQRGGTR